VSGSRSLGDCFLIFNILIVAGAVAFMRAKWGSGGWPDSWWTGTQTGDPDLPVGTRSRSLAGTLSRRKSAREALSGFALLRASDPDFDIDGFYKRVAEMFADLQVAAQRRDLSTAAHYIDSEAFAALQARVAAIPRETPIATSKAARIKAVSVRRENDTDLVRVMITAVSDRAGADPVTGSMLSEGDRVRFYAQEHWTLVRTVGARTLPEATIHRCPNCGGPITATTRAECGYCHTRLCDPNRDWVVSEIAGD